MQSCCCVRCNLSLLQAVQSISVVLYLNDFHQPAARDGCCPNEMRSQSSGVRISIQEHGVISDMMRGLAVAPGVETTVVFEDKVRQRLNEPYGDCTTRTRLGDPEDNLSYSVPGCKQLCVQKVVGKPLLQGLFRKLSSVWLLITIRLVNHVLMQYLL